MMQILQRSATMSDDAGLAQIAVTIVFGTTAIAAVILRFVSRRVSRVYLEMNDWMIVLALVRIFSPVVGAWADWYRFPHYAVSRQSLRVSLHLPVVNVSPADQRRCRARWFRKTSRSIVTKWDWDILEGVIRITTAQRVHHGILI